MHLENPCARIVIKINFEVTQKELLVIRNHSDFLALKKLYIFSSKA